MVIIMSMKEKNRFGLYIIAINIILILFLLTDSNANLEYMVTSCVSAFIAIIFNIVVLIKGKKKVINVSSLIVNIIIFAVVIIYTLSKTNVL